MLALRPREDIVTNSIDLILINILVGFMVGGLVIAFVMLCKKCYVISFSTLAGGLIVSLLYFIVLVIPSINPYPSTKGLALIKTASGEAIGDSYTGYTENT